MTYKQKISLLNVFVKNIFPPIVYNFIKSVFIDRVYKHKLVWGVVQSGPIKGRRFYCENYGLGNKIVSGSYDRALFESLPESLPKDGIILDIGGHIGYHAISLAAIFPANLLFCFEPVPGNVERIKKNILANSDLKDRIYVIPTAVGAKDGTVEMMIANDQGDGLMSMGFISSVSQKLHTARTSDYSKFYSKQVNITTLDNFKFPVHGNPALIKIDVEGAEIEVIKGGINLLRKHKPILFIEVHSVSISVELFGLLAELGYMISVIEDQSRNRCLIKAVAKMG